MYDSVVECWDRLSAGPVSSADWDKSLPLKKLSCRRFIRILMLHNSSMTAFPENTSAGLTISMPTITPTPGAADPKV
jgi:hypothetical protein